MIEKDDKKYYLFSSGNTIVFYNSSIPSTRQIRLELASLLTNNGGTIQLGSNSVECFNCNPFRLISGGSVTTNAAPVPEPGTILGLLAFGSLGALSRKRKG